MQVGVCQCKSSTAKIGGGCVRLSVIIPAIVVPVPTHMNEFYAYEWVPHIWTSTLRHAVSSRVTYKCVFVSVCLCGLWMRGRHCSSMWLMDACSWVFVCVTYGWVFVSVCLCDSWMRRTVCVMSHKDSHLSVRECSWLMNEAHNQNKYTKARLCASFMSHELEGSWLMNEAHNLALVYLFWSRYGVATTSRLLKITGLFCRI